MKHVPVRPANDLLMDMQTLLPGGTFPVVNPLIYTNAGALGDAAYRRWLFAVNAAGEVEQPPVTLGRYGDSCVINGSGPFHVLCGDALVAEHLAIEEPDRLAAHYAFFLGRAAHAVPVTQPCVMACHRGLWVWGHWLIDTLPRILLVERAFPGKFLFAVSDEITNPVSQRFFVRQVRESLAAYGIDGSRLFRLRHGVAYRFNALFDILNLRPPVGLQPVSRTALRALPAPPRFAGRHRLTASMRGRGESRAVTNREALDPVLRARGAAELDPAAAPFIDQVRAFRDSDVVVGDLGSNITAMVYADPGAAIVTLAPLGWRDTYYAGIFKRLGARHADVRGVSQAADASELDKAPHEVRPAHLDAGLQAAETPHRGDGPVLVEGRQMPRAVGPVLLRIDFTAAGNARPFQRRGFFPAETGGTWATGPACELVLPGFVPPGGDLWLELVGVGFVAPRASTSRVLGVAVNGMNLAELDIAGATRIHVLMPQDVQLQTPDLALSFHLGDCPSPRSLGISNDARPLGFMFETLSIRRLAA